MTESSRLGGNNRSGDPRKKSFFFGEGIKSLSQKGRLIGGRVIKEKGVSKKEDWGRCTWIWAGARRKWENYLLSSMQHLEKESSHREVGGDLGTQMDKKRAGPDMRQVEVLARKRSKFLRSFFRGNKRGTRSRIRPKKKKEKKKRAVQEHELIKCHYL